jgi:hypothetical protein
LRGCGHCASEGGREEQPSNHGEDVVGEWHSGAGAVAQLALLICYITI